MSTVHVFVGQCGNQVGTAFLDTIASEAEASSDEAFQMRVSATHFRPAMHVPRRYKQQQKNDRRITSKKNTQGDGAAPQRVSPSERVQRAGPQHYYSLSRYAQASSGTEASIDDASLPQPRCVLVDMEPKVIDNTLQRANAMDMPDSGSASTLAVPCRHFYTLAPQQCVTRGEGSGNNWAFGYYQQGQSRREAIAECLRRECEHQDTTVSTFHVLHSIAGGTGSGVSCLVAEEIKEMFSCATLLHSVIWPFHSGEVVTQWYNVLMAVSTLRDLADGVCIAYNDVVAEDLRSTHSNRGLKDVGEVSFSLINQRMSAMLAPLHLPQLLYTTPSPKKDASKNRIVSSTSGNRGVGSTKAVVMDGAAPCRYATSTDIVEALTLDPNMKFFTGVTVPKLVTGSSTWTAVLGEAARTAQSTFTSANAFPTGATAGASGIDASAFYLQHRSCLWSLHGRHASTDGIRELRHLMATHGINNNGERSAAAAPFPLTSLFVSPSEEWRETPSYKDRPDHVATLYGPTPMIGESLAEAARKAEELLNVGAFVHHFERYGVSKTELRDAAAVLWDTAAAYGE